MISQKALYYPFPFTQDDDWLKHSALYWDKLIRIIPRGFFEVNIKGDRVTTPSETEQIFREEFQFIEDYEVDYAVGLGDMRAPTLRAAIQLICFLDTIKDNYPSLFNEIVSDNREYFSWGILEHCKIGYMCGQLLDQLGAFTEQKSRHHRTFREFAGKLYMMFLASNISDEIGCPIITDDEEHDTILKISPLLSGTIRPPILKNALLNRLVGLEQDTDSGTREGIRPRLRYAWPDSMMEVEQGTRIETLACLSFQCIGIENLNDIAPKTIVKFRSKYEDERFAYLDSLSNSITKLNNSEIKSERHLDCLLRDSSKRLNQNIRDIKGALKGLNIQTVPYLIGVSTTVPLLSEMAKLMSIANPILTVGASAIGIAGILARISVERKRIFRGNRVGAYLFHLQREFEESGYLSRLTKTLMKFMSG